MGWTSVSLQTQLPKVSSERWNKNTFGNLFQIKDELLPESSNLTENKQKRAFGSKIVVIEVGLKKSLWKLLPVRKLIGDKKLGLNGCRKEVTIQSSFTPLPMLAEQSIGFQIYILMDPYAMTHSD